MDSSLVPPQPDRQADIEIPNSLGVLSDCVSLLPTKNELKAGMCVVEACVPSHLQGPDCAVSGHSAATNYPKVDPLHVLVSALHRAHLYHLPGNSPCPSS